MGNDGVIDALVSAMRTHKQGAEVVLHCATTLCCLALITDTHEDLVHRGGIKALATAIHQHSDNALVCEKAMRALVAMSPSGTCMTAVTKKAVIRATFHAMNKHADDGLIQNHGCFTLHCVSENDEAQTAFITQCGGIKTILRAIKLHTDNICIQAAGYGVLQRIYQTLDDAKKIAIWKHGRIQALVCALNVHMNTLGLVQPALSMLHFQCCNSSVEQMQQLKPLCCMEA
jgi:hypothetical protein